MFGDLLEAFLKIVLIACIILIPICAIGMYYEWKDCRDRGGEMVGTGEYTTTVIVSGNSVIPMTTEDEVCSK